jgi:hypothetical protein
MVEKILRIHRARLRQNQERLQQFEVHHLSGNALCIDADTGN